MQRSIVLCGAVSVIMAVSASVFVLGAAVPHLAAAQGGSGSALPTGDDEHIVGSYVSDLTGGAESPRPTITTFAEDGTVTTSTLGGNPALTLTEEHGTWVRTGDHTYALTEFRVMRDASGNQSLQRGRQTISLNATSSGYTATQSILETLDASGNVVGVPQTGTIQATRINVVPIPSDP